MKTTSTRSGARRLLAISAVGALALAAAVSPGQASSSHSAAGSLTGAGSTLVYPLVSQWGADYQSSAGVGITYGPHACIDTATFAGVAIATLADPPLWELGVASRDEALRGAAGRAFLDAYRARCSERAPRSGPDLS